jgi:hypothetical protein
MLKTVSRSIATQAPPYSHSNAITRAHCCFVVLFDGLRFYRPELCYGLVTAECGTIGVRGMVFENPRTLRVRPHKT